MAEPLRKVLGSTRMGGAERASTMPAPAFQDINRNNIIPAGERDPYSVTAFADLTDRTLHAAMARFTAGISPAAMAQAYLDWAAHLATSPGKRAQLLAKAIRKAIRLGRYVNQYAVAGSHTERCIEPLPQDHRFGDPAWQQWPFNLMYQG